MATAKATLSNFRQSPRKMRGVANLVRGKNAKEALVHLQFTTKRASNPIATLIASALANAKAQDLPVDNLVVKKIAVNAGKTLMRRRPAAHGSAHKINKRTSHVSVELGEATVVKKTKIKKELK
jgi:large subunit ribosomal protein L22